MKKMQISSCSYLLTLLFLVSCCKAKAQRIETVTTAAYDTAAIATQNDSTIVPKEYVGTIVQADSVIWYIIDAFSVASDSTKMLEGFGEILSFKAEIRPEAIGALKATLTYSGSFEDTDLVKECTFLPDVAIEFVHEADTVIVAYSFYCDICRFYISGTYRDFDGERIKNAILQLACEIFPSDKYLRNLNRKEI